MHLNDEYKSNFINFFLLLDGRNVVFSIYDFEYLGKGILILDINFNVAELHWFMTLEMYF